MNANDLRVIEQHKEIIQNMIKNTKSMTSAMLASDPSRHNDVKKQISSAQGLLDIHHRYKVEHNFKEFESVYEDSGDLFFKEELKEYYNVKRQYCFVLDAISEVIKPKNSKFKWW